MTGLICEKKGRRRDLNPEAVEIYDFILLEDPRIMHKSEICENTGPATSGINDNQRFCRMWCCQNYDFIASIQDSKRVRLLKFFNFRSSLKASDRECT